MKKKKTTHHNAKAESRHLRSIFPESASLELCSHSETVQVGRRMVHWGSKILGEGESLSLIAGGVVAQYLADQAQNS